MCHADHNAAIPIRPFVAACVLRHCRDNVLRRALLNTGLGTTGIDMRQVFLTPGNESMGTFMLGRNFERDLVETNKKYTLGAYYSLTKNLTLIGEFTDTKAEAHNAIENDSNNFNLGAYLSF